MFRLGFDELNINFETMKRITVCFLAVLTVLTGCTVNIDWASEDDESSTKSVPVTEKTESDVDGDSIKSNVAAPTIKGIEEKTLTEQLNTPINIISDIGLIEQYYSLIGEGKLEEAYAMKYDTKTTFKTFQGWYKNTASATVRDIEENPDHKYSFYVDLINKDKTEETYMVKMDVIDGKLKTTSSVAVPEMSLRLAVKDGIEYLYLDRKGQAELIAPNFTNAGTNDENHMTDYKFLQGNKYIAYSVTGTASRTTEVYKISSKQVVVSLTDPSMYGFTDDERFFYACQGAGMMGGYLDIFKVKGDTLSLYKSLEPTPGNGMIADCIGYNKDQGYFEYNLTYGGFDEAFRTKYYFE